MIRKLVAMPVAPAGSKVLQHRNVKHEDDMCPRFISVVRDMNDTNLCVRTRFLFVQIIFLWRFALHVDIYF